MTPVLSVEQMAFAYPDLPLFRDWSHVFPPGLTWVAATTDAASRRCCACSAARSNRARGASATARSMPRPSRSTTAVASTGAGPTDRHSIT